MINWKTTICIEVSKYNEAQLFVIGEQLNIQEGFLKLLKDEGSVRVYWDMTKPYVIGSIKRKELHNAFTKSLYKGLYLNHNYASLTKKDKDKLLKLEPYQFKTKKNNTKPWNISGTYTEVSSNDEVEVVENVSVEEILEIDAILDKILEYGISSLTKNEKDFLDNYNEK